MTIATELVIIRHGETDWNKEHRLQGQGKPGPPLNDMGCKQTEMLSHVMLKRYSHFDAVISSDLLRTIQTAEILAAGYQLEVQQHPGLRERHIGVLQGLTNLEAPAVQPEAWAALQSSSSSARIPGGGESMDDLKERLAATLLDIAAQYPGKRVMVVSHGGALHATHRAARGYEAKGKVSNCSISVVMAEPSLHNQHLQQQLSSMQCDASASDGSSCTALGGGSACCSGTGGCDSSADGSCCCSRDGNCGSCCGQRSSSIAIEATSASGSIEHMLLKKPATVAHAAPVAGRLSLVVWNDAAALFDLEAEEGVGMRAAGFGGSAREA